MIERQAETFGNPRLNLVHFGAIFRDRFARFGGGQFGGGAVFVCGTQEQHLVTARAQIAGVKIGRQLAAHKVT